MLLGSIDGEESILTANQRKAITEELKFRKFQLGKSSDRWFTNKSAKRVGDRVGVSKPSITKWRKRQDYRCAFLSGYSKRITPGIESRLHSRDEAFRLWKDAVAAEWSGPKACPTCGVVFELPAAYSRHIKNNHPDYLAET